MARGSISSETIQSQGKQSKIEYKYAADRLVAAECGEDPSLDSRSRQVQFLN